MRRALAILKYVPVVLCGLLAVAWVVSLFFRFGARFDQMLWYCQRGELGFTQFPAGTPSTGLFICDSATNSSWLGTLAIARYAIFGQYDVCFPIPVFLAIFLPLAIGPINRFRFPLWSYFAWTALVAVELAFYLRA